MLSGTKRKSVVGLDIEAGSVAAAEVSVNGGVTVTRHGFASLPPGAFREGEVVDAELLAPVLKDLFAREKLPKTVRVGVANQRVVVRTLRLPPIENPSELETAIRFQARDQIPMPLEQAVLEWQVAGTSPSDGGAPAVDVVVVAARRDMVTSLVGALRKAGLRPAGIDLSAFGMIRALAREVHTAVSPADYIEAPAAGGGEEGQAEDDASAPAKLYCNLGDVTNLAVARGSTCLFTRISPFGLEGMAQKLAERRGLTLEHAREWLSHVGLEQPVQSIDGDPEHVSATREALSQGAGKLVEELRMTLDYYASQEGAMPIEGIVACGPGTTVPGLLERLARDLGHRCEVGRPAALASLGEATAARLTLPYGLALEE
jgi:type IV pilus assembly protein PilM